MYTKAFLKPQPSATADLPLFQPQVVQGGRPDGYWVEAFPFRAGDAKCPNIVGYGLGTEQSKSDIQMLKNPYAQRRVRNLASVELTTYHVSLAKTRRLYGSL